MSGSADYLPAISVHPAGVLVLRRHWNEDETWLTIIRADPHVEFTDELLREFSSGGDNDGMYPDVELDPPGHRHSTTPDRNVCFTDCMIRIQGRDRTVIYRIGNYRLRSHTWEASWPD